MDEHRSRVPKKVDRIPESNGYHKPKEPKDIGIGPWTVRKVRDELPDVTVRPSLGGRTYTCRVLGRRLRFAELSICKDDVGVTFQVSWETVARSLNTGEPIRLG